MVKCLANLLTKYFYRYFNSDMFEVNIKIVTYQVYAELRSMRVVGKELRISAIVHYFEFHCLILFVLPTLRTVQ